MRSGPKSGHPAKPGGNKRTFDIHEVINGVMYVLSPGCQWRAIPNDLPPKSTMHDYLEPRIRAVAGSGFTVLST